ncbi:glycosyl hydrolase, partial [Mycobacterium sp. ITM-2017-0098]
LADLLFGAVNPSGRLAETIPVRLADTASYVNFPGEQGHVRYGEGVMVGYRWHETVAVPARYPFGYGLSYTTFAVADLTVEATGDDSARATVTVSNTGDRPGSEVVQLYIAAADGPVRRPVRELRAFSKVYLQPAETRTVAMELDARAFAYWDVEQQDWVVAPGTYAVQICRDAATVALEVAVTLAGHLPVRELTLESTVQEWCTHPAVGAEFLAQVAAASPDGQGGADATADLLQMVGSMPMQTVVNMLGAAAPVAALTRLMARTRPTTDRL